MKTYKFRELINDPVKEAPTFIGEPLKYLIIRNPYDSLLKSDDAVIGIFYSEVEARNYISRCTSCPEFYRVAILEGEL